MKPVKLWSNKGVALYPVDFPLVGQNAVFSGLLKFKQAFQSAQGNDIAGFFALIGDWGLGKTRIGYELFAQICDHVERWILNDEYVVPHDPRGRLLRSQLVEGILPLYLRYDMVCGPQLFAENWVARVATAALSLVCRPPAGHDVPPKLIEDQRDALRARGVDLDALGATLDGEDDGARLAAAMTILRNHGIQHLWVVVDEVETLGDRKKGLRDEEGEGIAEDYLDMVSTVIKHESYRSAHPYVNFLVLCSSGMRDRIEIGPNRRRTDSIELEPNLIADVHTYVNELRERAEASGQPIDYPAGTLEGAFIACNRNFGWFNVMMSSIHESYRAARMEGRSLAAWQLIEEYARGETRAKWVFDLGVLELLKGAKGASSEAIRRLVFGQVPVLVKDDEETQVAALRQVSIPGLGTAPFVDLVEVQLDARTLGEELVRPEIGFRISPRGGDRYLYYNSELSLSGVLAALHAFSVPVDPPNFLVCRELSDFTAQLGALYERPGVDVPQIAEPLHGVFLRYQVPGRRFQGPSFALLQRLDLLLKREAVTAAFLQDPQKDAALEAYAQEIAKSERKRQTAICQGFARLLDQSLPGDVPSVAQVQSAAAITFTSTFASPRFEGLQVTPQGQLTVAYGRDLEKLAQELGDILGQTAVHPIVVLLPAGMTLEDWHRLSLPPRVRLCVIPRALTRVEEAFLIKYSGRGTAFRATDLLSARTQSTRGTLEQSWQAETLNWRTTLENKGYLLRPLWHSIRVAEGDFNRAYRTMLVKGWDIDGLAPDHNPELDAATYDRMRKACQFNAEPGPGQEPTLEVISRTEPYQPIIPPAFGALMAELTSDTSLDSLVRRFFFAGAERNKASKYLQQILELLRELGLVSMGKLTYRAVAAPTVKQYREAASAWLNGECKTLIAELGDTFTSETVERLRKGATSFAPNHLKQAEQAAGQANLNALSQGTGVTPDMVRQLVRQIDRVEAELQQICPPAVYKGLAQQAFQLDVAGIATFEAQLSSHSLWEQVHFSHWLRGQYQQRQEELAHAIQEQIAEAKALDTVDGCPFPISPLTIPLKAIYEEVDLSGGIGRSSRGALLVPGYPQAFGMYLFMGKYAEAWERLRALSQYVERAQPTSFWARFNLQRQQWENHVRTFRQASTAWETLARFVGDAASPAWAGAKSIKASLEQLRGLVEGGLAQAVNADADQGPDKLIETLQAEVEAAVKYRSLLDDIAKLRQQVESELDGIIDRTRLRALTRVLQARHRSQLAVPAKAATYAETRASYEAFNVKVSEKGRSYFEEGGKQTPFDRWVDIYTRLDQGTYKITSEDETSLRELEDMKLIERTVRLAA